MSALPGTTVDKNLGPINAVMNKLTAANEEYEMAKAWGKIHVEISYEKGVIKSHSVERKQIEKHS